METKTKNYQLETKWAKTVIHNPFVVIATSLLVIMLLAYGARYATMSSDYRYFFGEDNPQRLAFESLQNVYSKDDSVLMTVTPKDGQVFKKETLEGLQFLTSESWKLPFVTRVDSLTNFQHSYAEGDNLIVKDLVEDNDLVANGNALSSYKDIALNEPLLVNRLINEEASVTGINVKMTFPGNHPFEVPDAAEAARQLADVFKQKYPGHEVHLSGMVMLNDAFNEAGIRDVITLMPIMYGLIVVLLLIILKSKAAVVSTMGVMLLSIMGAMGFSGWASIPITPPSSIAPTVIMTLAIAHSIHILKTLFKTMGNGVAREEAIIESLRQNLKPVFLTSLTTIIGFLSLNFSDTPPFHDLGNLTAIGVALAFILSVGFLPAIMSRVNLKVPRVQNSENKLASRYTAWLDRRGTTIILVMAFLTTFLGLQIGNIKINDQFVGYFDSSIQYRPDSEYIIENLTGVYQLNFDMESGETQGIARPDYLENLERFVTYMQSVPGVVHVSSITDTFKRLNMNMHADDPAYYQLPDERELAAQYLLLYEMSLPYGLDLNSQINVDKSASRVIVTMEEVPTSRILEISALASNWLQNNTPPEMHAQATSPTVMFSHITERNIHSMLWGTLIAFSLITLIMIIALRSVKYGLISLLPNVIPATLAIGVWALLIGEAGFSIAFVASVTLGIIVDDTVHFLSKFNYAKNHGHDTDSAVSYALEHVGAALISTSIILVIGFSVLMLSGFKLNFVLGALSALTIAIALLVDFTFLPAMLRVSDKLNFSKGGVMKTKYASYTAAVIFSAIALSATLDANASTKPEEDKGKWVAESADNFDSGFTNQSAKVTMVLQNAHGQKAQRELRIKILEVNNDGDKSLTTFDTPRDVKGTSFLSYSHSLNPDEQWLYLPSLKRVKRISSNNKSGPFMGSEFAYEDLSSQEVDKYTYKYVEATTVLGEAGHIIERKPVDPNSGYARQRVWVDGTYWRTQKIEFYDRKNELLKTLVYADYQRYDNNKWRADTMTMTNHQNGKSTTLHWKDIQFGINVSSRDFDQNALKRIR
jgi:predicted RND superfamily exporter protein/outer membrane lipoprotein-sorting protein